MNSSHLRGPDGPIRLRPRRVGIPQSTIVRQSVCAYWLRISITHLMKTGFP